MITPTMEISCFDGTGDFMLWKVRMLAHLGILGLKDILKDDQLLKDAEGADKSSTTTGDSGGLVVAMSSMTLDLAKVDKSDRAKNYIIANVADVVLMNIHHCSTAADMWNVLEKTYMSTTLPNRIYLQNMFYTFKMSDDISLDMNINNFQKLVADLNSIGIRVAIEAQALLLMNSLPSRFDQLKETLKFARESIIVEEVIVAAKAKETELKESGSTSRVGGEGLYVKENDDKKNYVAKQESYRGR